MFKLGQFGQIMFPRVSLAITCGFCLFDFILYAALRSRVKHSTTEPLGSQHFKASDMFIIF